MLEKVIGGGIGAIVVRAVGGIGIAAMGGAVGIPAAAVAAIGVIGGAIAGNQVGKLVDAVKK